MTLAQSVASKWVHDTFGEDCALDCTERAKRVLEEAIELAQASGVSEDDVDFITHYVYRRDVGEIDQEVGGVAITLAALCTANGLNLETEMWREIRRVLALPKEKFVAKRKLKHAAGITRYGG